jgi:hypothetical protein
MIMIMKLVSVCVHDLLRSKADNHDLFFRG